MTNFDLWLINYFTSFDWFLNYIKFLIIRFFAFRVVCTCSCLHRVRRGLPPYIRPVPCSQSWPRSSRGHRRPGWGRWLVHCSRPGINININETKVLMQVISEVYAFFVLQCTVFGRKIKHKTDVTAWHGIHFHKNNLWNILVIGNNFVNYQNYQNLILLGY